MYKLMKNYPFIKHQLCLKRHYQKSYYDTLGLTPKATHADIKSAYYDLSMKYHPDKYSGKDQKFQEINSAYEVLGNVKLRRLYDRGLLTAGRPPPDPSDIPPEPPERENKRTTDSKFYRSQQAPTSSGRTRVYDFDEWYISRVSETIMQRAHYEKYRAREDKRKYNEMKYQANRRYVKEQQDPDYFAWFLIVLTFTFVAATLFPTRSIDRPSKPRNNSSNSSSSSSNNNNTNSNSNKSDKPIDR